MNKSKNTEEKICAFYVSDYHFEMISLPYIEQKLEDKKEIIILTENNLENTISNLISKMNLKEDKKNNILNIDWQNNDLKKFKKIKENVKNEKEFIIFIKGKQNYIKNINENIEKWIDGNSKVKIVDCYDFDEVKGNMKEIMQKYKKTLSTTGEKVI